MLVWSPGQHYSKLACVHSCICFSTVWLYDYKLWPLSARQQKSLPALRLSLLNSQQSLTQPPQQGVKPVPSGTPPAIIAGPAVCIRHPNSVSTTTGASALPAGTLGHAAAMVCMEQISSNRLLHRHIFLTIDIYTFYCNWIKVWTDFVVITEEGHTSAIWLVTVQFH